MPSKYALTVSLTEHLCHFVEGQVGSGRYRTASEVVREALRLLEAQFSNPMLSTQNAVAPGDEPQAPVAEKIERGVPAQRRGRAL